MNEIPRRLVDQQRLAADPALSAWVTANAGSGKTHVLVQRVLRLLLDGVDPARLLCLTFTNAAAAQMADRVSVALGGWAVADDAALAAALADTLGRPAGLAETERARRLFAQAIETPGRLKIQTIHAFCERVLQLFPFEAGVPAGFDVLEEVQTRALTEAALSAVLVEAERDPSGEAAAALDAILSRRSESQMRTALATLIGKRGRYLAWRRAGGTAHRHLRIDPALTPEAVLSSFADSSQLILRGWSRACEELGANGTVAMTKLAEIFSGAGAERLAQARCLVAAYFTRTNGPLSNFPAKSLQKSAPALHAAFDADREAAIAAMDRLLAIEMAAASEALFDFADRVLATYDRLKAAASALDFDDLIARMGSLLESGHGPWVLYRLDRGIDHILVDEAQDTSPEQWRIVRALAEEFFAGKGASEKTRTIFAVGDEKQSIYSFQGADPEGFRAMRSLFSRRVESAKQIFRGIDLTHSFRSAIHVLGSVDAVFKSPDAARGVAEFGADGTTRGIAHIAVRAGVPGLVELWPPVPANDRSESIPWDAPLDRDDETHNTVILSRMIASKIKALIDAGTPVPSTARDGGPPRGAQEGDFLILLRKRTRLARPIVKALKDAGLKVAGADRLRIADHIAIQDLIGLGILCWLPQDDLTLASVLKSPLFGLGEDDIYLLAVDRPGSLHEALGASADPRHRAAFDRLEAWRRVGTAARPFDFYANVLGAGSGRDAIHARMGIEALDPVDEFLSLALTFERGRAATLPGFISWIGGGGAEVKRDMDEDGGEIRVMTIHGSKGLEAPIVFLPDTMSVPGGGDLDPVLFAGAGDPFEPARGVLWMAPEKDCPSIARTLRQGALERAQEEYRRLLYVAMTRAKDRLYICGAAGRNNPSGAHWHGLAEAGIRPLAHEVETPEGKVLRVGSEDQRAAQAGAQLAAPGALPAWATVSPEPETPVIRRRPSARFAGNEAAVRRGTLVHFLLEILPGIAPALRAEAAASHLATHAADWPPETRRALADSVLALLASPDFAAVFAAGSEAEVAIAGTLQDAEGPRFVSGRVDRLVMTDEDLLIVDFKSDTDPPPPGAALPAYYAAQMEDYRRLAAAAHPNHRVRIAILWTAVPRLDTVTP